MRKSRIHSFLQEVLATTALCVGLLASIPGTANALFVAARFEEDVYLAEFRVGEDTASDPDQQVPHSVALDYSGQNGVDSIAASANAQSNGGLNPATDASMSFRATMTPGATITGRARARVRYEFRVDYVGGETPPVSIIPLVFTYRMDVRAQNGGSSCIDCSATSTSVLELNNTLLDIVQAGFTGTGVNILRVSEVVRLRPTDIDSTRCARTRSR